MASTTATTAAAMGETAKNGNYTIAEYATHVPRFDEIVSLFNSSLGHHYNEFTVEIVDCPNLTKEPFHLADEGLCGSPAAADVGGVPYLVPLAQTGKEPYSLESITKQINYSRAFYVGASAGPFQVVGTNSELMPNCLVSRNDEQEANLKREQERIQGQGKEGEEEKDQLKKPQGEKVDFFVKSATHCTKLDRSSSKGYTTFKLPRDCDQFCLLGNLFISNGLPGKVVRVTAKGRKGSSSNNFITNLRGILATQYNENTKKQVTLGGVFLIKSGKVKVHIMPDFSKVPLCTDEDVNNWLNYFEVSAPLVALTLFHSYDPGQDLRIEHTHCFSTHGDGGHYHYDTTPDEVEYEGYFNIASKVYRIDAPIETHTIGRD